MAGHSQFKNIMHKKGKQDAIRSKLFSKLAREITVAAKMGMPDLNMNPRLRLAVLAARAENMPKDNIERAIKKASAADTRELRGGALRGLCARRRRRHRRGADRQPQPHGRRGALLFHQGRRRARRNRRRLLHVRSRRARSSTTRRPAATTRCWRRPSKPAPTTCSPGAEEHEIVTSIEALRDAQKALEAKFGEPRKASHRLAAAEHHRRRRRGGRENPQADRRAGRQRRRAERDRQFRSQRRVGGADAGVSRCLT